MTLDFLDNASFKYYVEREKYESDEVSAFLSCIVSNPDCYVLDIGANYGPYTLAAANLGRSHLIRKIIAIEPDPRPYAALCRSIVRNRFQNMVNVHRCIVSDHVGEEILFVNVRSSADNRTFRVTSAPISVRAQHSVTCTTIDQILEDSSVSKSSKFIIKMDIQGNEPRAFRGMKETLLQAEGFVVFFEHARYLIESAEFEIPEYYKLLKDIRFDQVYQISEKGIIQLDGIDGLLKSFDELDSKVEKKMQGPGGNYVLCRNMKLCPASRSTSAASAS